MSKTEKSFELTGTIIVRLLLFFIIYLAVNYFFLTSNLALPSSVTTYSQNLSSTIATSAQAGLAKYSTTSAAVSWVNNLLAGKVLGDQVGNLSTEVTKFFDRQVKKYQRQLIDKIYQDLTKPTP